MRPNDLVTHRVSVFVLFYRFCKYSLVIMLRGISKQGGTSVGLIVRDWDGGEGRRGTGRRERGAKRVRGFCSRPSLGFGALLWRSEVEVELGIFIERKRYRNLG